jgi:chemotaxis signal transduction protein
MEGFLLFTSGRWRLALPLERVRQVIGAAEVTFVRSGDGLAEVNIGGYLLPLVDPVGVERGEPGDPAEVVALTEEKGLTAGILIDKIVAIHRVSRDVVRPLPVRFARPGSVSDGLVEHDEFLYVLMNVGRAVAQGPRAWAVGEGVRVARPAGRGDPAECDPGRHPGVTEQDKTPEEGAAP